MRDSTSSSTSMPAAFEAHALREVVLRDHEAGRWLIFSDPVAVLGAATVGEVIPVVEEAAGRVREEGLYAAGFLSYEAAPAFDSAYSAHPPGDFPLASFGLFRGPRILKTLPPGNGGGAPAWRIPEERGRYGEAIAEIRRRIARGDTYQVNYTVRQHAADCGDSWSLFRSIATDAPHAAYVDAGDYAIASASPELFFALSGDALICSPMKGTAPRGLTSRQDEDNRESLSRSVKDRAENVMIADMVRNDLGRVAAPGSVKARSLFNVEKYRTVWQMTSTITARTEAPVPDILRALFPAASITGAPKVSSMRLIAALEDTPRNVYTGCIGFIGPRRQARFNVAIRTALVDRRRGHAVYGVGGGIVWDSDADSEYEECLHKARILDTPEEADFRLLETILWTRDDGYFLLHEHLERLGASARYFDFRFDRIRLEEELRALALTLRGRACRIRALLGRDGETTLQTNEIPRSSPGDVLRVRLSCRPVDPRNPYLYHKTTRREIYEHALAGAGDCDDVLLWNARGEVTESSTANIVARVGGALYTPPVESGLLAGTLRGSLLRQGRLKERVIRTDELPALDELYLINSVRGWCRAALAEESAAGLMPLDELHEGRRVGVP